MLRSKCYQEHLWLWAGKVMAYLINSPENAVNWRLMPPHSPPLISPPENLNYVVLITQFMTHFTRPKFMFQWISVSPPAVWICAVQFLGFVFSDSRFIVLVSLTIYFPIGFVSPPQFPIFATTRGVGGGVYWPRSQAVCWRTKAGRWNKRPLASGFVRLCDRIVCSEGFQPGRVTPGHRQAINCTDSQFHQLAKIEQNHFFLRQVF